MDPTASIPQRPAAGRAGWPRPTLPAARRGSAPGANGEQPGQHHSAHLAAAELVDASLGRWGWKPTEDRQRAGHPGLSSRGEKPRRRSNSPSRPGFASTAGGRPGTTTPPRQLAHQWADSRPPGKRRSVGTVQTGHDPRQRRLARAVTAVDQYPVSLLHHEADVAQRGLGPGEVRAPVYVPSPTSSSAGTSLR